VLADGSYDALVIDVAARDGGVVVSVTLTAGGAKGAVVDVVAAGLDERDALARLGEPCTLHVRAGTPTLAFA
jgi:hypothetical protein